MHTVYVIHTVLATPSSKLSHNAQSQTRARTWLPAGALAGKSSVLPTPSLVSAIQLLLRTTGISPEFTPTHHSPHAFSSTPAPLLLHQPAQASAVATTSAALAPHQAIPPPSSPSSSTSSLPSPITMPSSPPRPTPQKARRASRGQDVKFPAASRPPELQSAGESSDSVGQQGSGHVISGHVMKGAACGYLSKGTANVEASSMHSPSISALLHSLWGQVGRGVCALCVACARYMCMCVLLLPP